MTEEIITVSREKLVKETFRLIGLELYFCGCQVMLKVPPSLPQIRVKSIQIRANLAIPKYLSGVSTVKEDL